MRLAAMTPIQPAILLIAVALSVNQAAATTYYVRKTGDDDNSGTLPSQAWQTLENAAEQMQAGDTLYVGAGTYNEEVELLRNGTSSNPIRFVADVSGAMTGDAGVVEVTKSAAPAFTVDADYIELVGFRLFGWDNALEWNSGVGGLLQDCEVDGNSKEAILLRNAGIELTIVNCDIHNNGWDGLKLNNACTVNVARSSFRNNGRCGLNLGNAGGTSFTLSDCSVYGNTDHGVRVDQGSGTITNCLIYNNGGAGVIAAGTSTGKSLTIRNSTIASNADYGVRQEQGTLAITNSIIANNSTYGLSYSSGTLTHTYNLLFGNTNGDYQGTAADPTELSEDPLFENISSFDYHLTSGSPAIDAGADAAGTVDDDLEGNARPFAGGWDLGCYESPFSGSTNGWRVRQWTEIDKP